MFTDKLLQGGKIMKQRVLAIIAASAGAAVGLLLTGRAWRRSGSAASDSLPIPVSNDRKAEVIRHAPALDEIAREATRETREQNCRASVSSRSELQ
jgi:hypothetical protein